MNTDEKEFDPPLLRMKTARAKSLLASVFIGVQPWFGFSV